MEPNTSSVYTELLAAVRVGDALTVERLTRNGVGVDWRDDDGFPLLHVAFRGLREATESHRRHWYLWTIDHLVARGADPNAEDVLGRTVLDLRFTSRNRFVRAARRLVGENGGVKGPAAVPLGQFRRFAQRDDKGRIGCLRTKEDGEIWMTMRLV